MDSQITQVMAQTESYNMIQSQWLVQNKQYPTLQGSSRSTKSIWNQHKSSSFSNKHVQAAIQKSNQN